MDVLDNTKVSVPDFNFREILVKKPWFQILPISNSTKQVVTDKNNTNEYFRDKAFYATLTQEEMLRQYYPTGHKINDKLLYPDIYKQNPDDGKWYVQPITRVSLAFQQIIKTKHTIHVAGNDVQFELTDENNNDNILKHQNALTIEGDGVEDEQIFETSEDDNIRLLTLFKKGWMDMKMEMHWYDCVSSYMTVAECALVGYIDNGKVGCRTFSFLNDDILYPHFDSITGELTLFARKYYDYDEDGVAITEWVEVWDDKNLYRCKRGTPDSNFFVKIKDTLGLNGFEVVSAKPHGFNFVPVAYLRNEEGPCWLPAQDTIEKFEEAMSYFFENNKAFAFPILVVTGEGVELNGDANGAVKSISIDSSDGDAHFLDNNDVSASYNTLLTKFYDLIYEQSFTVKPPELKSGDLPGVALKLLYSPAIERAIQDSQKFQPFIEQCVRIVKYAWGLHENCQASLMNLSINSWIEPYVHQNDTELITNLATAVQNNFVSMRTASERCTKYAKNDEYERITKEMKEQMMLKVAEKNLEQTHSTEEAIRKAKATTDFQSGQDINTAYGEGSEHINETDENGNREGENNWDDFNKTRFAY